MNKILCKCQICDSVFFLWPSKLKRGGRYCSKKCLGIAQRGINNPHWKGGKITSKDGYIMIYMPDYPYHNGQGIYVYEHRYVMEKYLGRILNSHEVVHHLNGIRNDNRIENLKLLKNHGKHLMIYHRKEKTGKFLRCQYCNKLSYRKPSKVNIYKYCSNTCKMKFEWQKNGGNIYRKLHSN